MFIFGGVGWWSVLACLLTDLGWVTQGALVEQVPLAVPPGDKLSVT